MRYFRKLKQMNFNKHINIDRLSTKLCKEISQDSKSSLESVNLALIGLKKVLGRGISVGKPIIVKANSFSKLAIKKIKRAGGYCINTP